MVAALVESCARRQAPLMQAGRGLARRGAGCSAPPGTPRGVNEGSDRPLAETQPQFEAQISQQSGFAAGHTVIGAMGTSALLLAATWGKPVRLRPQRVRGEGTSWRCCTGWALKLLLPQKANAPGWRRKPGACWRALPAPA